MGKLDIVLAIGEGIVAGVAAIHRRSGKAGDRKPGASDRTEPSDALEAEAIAAIRGECEAAGDTLETVLWTAFLGSLRRSAEARAQAHDTVLSGYLLMFAWPVAVIGGWFTKQGLGFHGTGATVAYFVAAGLLSVAAAIHFRDFAAARRMLRLPQKLNGSGKLVVALGGRFVYKAWFEDGTKVRVASTPREGASVVETGARYEIHDRAGRHFVDLDPTRQKSRDVIIDALGGVARARRERGWTR